MHIEEHEEIHFVYNGKIESKLLPGVFIEHDNFMCPLCKVVFHLPCYGTRSICHCGYMWIRLKWGLRIVKDIK